MGWGGIGPVSDLIEYVLGFNVNAPQNTIEWHINRQDQHGIENLAVGGVTVELLCDARKSAKDLCHLTCQSTGDLTLKVFVQETASVHHLSKGRTEFVIG